MKRPPSLPWVIGGVLIALAVIGSLAWGALRAPASDAPNGWIPPQARAHGPAPSSS